VFSHIVVGTDGSDTAAIAVTLATGLAKQHGAVLHLVNAYKAPSAGPGMVQAGPVGVAGEELGAEASKTASMALLAEATEQTGYDKVESHSVKDHPADAVVDVATDVGAELIVVGSKGMQGARRVIGSVPNSIAHKAPCHVLIAKTI
jgi:nucleotide-binding universal stress UspA family protein